MPHFSLKDHLRWIIGIVVWKFELGFEVAALVQGILGTFENHVPDEEIVIILQANRS